MKKTLILIFVILLGAGASYYFGELWEKKTRDERIIARNDSIAERVAYLMARADSLETLANEGRESDDRIGSAYIDAIISLHEARVAAAEADPPMPDPVDPAREERLVETLAIIDTILRHQLILTDGMPYARSRVESRIAAIDSITAAARKK